MRQWTETPSHTRRPLARRITMFRFLMIALFLACAAAFQAPLSEGDDAVAMMYDLASNYRIDVCYCSVLDECWLARTIGTVTPKPESVDACPVEGVSFL